MIIFLRDVLDKEKIYPRQRLTFFEIRDWLINFMIIFMIQKDRTINWIRKEFSIPLDGKD